MRSIFAALALSLFSAITVMASTSVEIKRVGVIESDGEIEILTAPSSTLLVRVDFEIEEFQVGVYARYAQRCLGVQAPLVAKKRAEITDASIALAPEKSYVADAAFTSNLESELLDSSVELLPINLLSAQVVAADRLAASAAEELFSIRQLRIDILSGDMGEGFYSAGLEAALEALAQREVALTELFMGRTVRTRESRVFEIPLEGSTSSYRVCRFSSSNGIVDLSDVSENLIMLSIKAIEEPRIKSEKSDDKSRVQTYRVAVPSKCELHTQERSLTQSIIPLFEFGYDLNYVFSNKK